MYSALRQSVIALLLAAVVGCGQMGPLYLPEAPAAEDSAPAAEDSAPAAGDPAPAADTPWPDDEEG
ncbi:MAG: hypothetical protein HKN19_02160 [Halioglobus sp.]|nr:hypothetical protein [Halioglobus sp.]